MTTPALSDQKRPSPVCRSVGRPLLARADDAGLSVGTNLAIDDCVRGGPVRNVSVLAVGPAVRHAAAVFGGREDVAVGCHVAFTCEWDDVRFGPVLAAGPASGLVGPDGRFGTRADQLARRGVSIDLLTREATAQVGRLRELGLPLVYLDTHMGVSWVPGVGEALAKLCEAEGLVFVDALLRQGAITEDRSIGKAADDAFVGGRPVLWVGHPMRLMPGESAPHGPGLPGATVAARREADLVALSVPAVGWRPLRFDDPALRHAAGQHDSCLG